MPTGISLIYTGWLPHGNSFGVEMPPSKIEGQFWIAGVKGGKFDL